jgi:hypothetical protein
VDVDDPADSPKPPVTEAIAVHDDYAFAGQKCARKSEFWNEEKNSTGSRNGKHLARRSGISCRSSRSDPGTGVVYSGESVYERTLVITEAATGCRISECLALKWLAIEWEKSLIRGTACLGAGKNWAYSQRPVKPHFRCIRIPRELGLRGACWSGGGPRQFSSRTGASTGAPNIRMNETCDATPVVLFGYSRVSGSSSAVERQLPKLDVAGSIPVSRSIL